MTHSCSVPSIYPTFYDAYLSSTIEKIWKMSEGIFFVIVFWHWKSSRYAAHITGVATIDGIRHNFFYWLLLHVLIVAKRTRIYENEIWKKKKKNTCWQFESIFPIEWVNGLIESQSHHISFVRYWFARHNQLTSAFNSYDWRQPNILN